MDYSISPKIVIFSIPKGFGDDVAVDVIQRNAFKTWVNLADTVVLYGDESGVPEVARELGCVSHQNIRRNEFGTPILSDAFSSVGRIILATSIFMRMLISYSHIRSKFRLNGFFITSNKIRHG